MMNIVNTAYFIDNFKEEIVNSSSVSNLFTMKKEDFFRHLANQLPLITYKLKWFPNARLKRLGAVIYTNGDNRPFNVKFSRIVAGEIHAIVSCYLRQKS